MAGSMGRELGEPVMYDCCKHCTSHTGFNLHTVPCTVCQPNENSALSKALDKIDDILFKAEK